MEGHINAGQRNRCEATLEFQMTFVFLLMQHPLMARFDDVSEQFLDLLNAAGFSQLNE
jgi:hypothetical protein